MKELPYFQFEPGQYMSGNIMFCSLAAQGLFANILCLYWQRGCDLTLKQIKRKFDNQDLIDELIKDEVLKINGDIIVIDFLNEQYAKLSGSKQRLSDAGKKGQAVKKSRANSKPPDNQQTIGYTPVTGKEPDTTFVTIEALNNEQKLMQISRKHKVSYDQVLKWVKSFEESRGIDEKTYPSTAQLLNHFDNYCGKQKEKLGSNPDIKNNSFTTGKH